MAQIQQFVEQIKGMTVLELNEFLKAFDKAIQAGTRAGIEGRLRFRFPLVEKTKSQIVALGRSLGTPLELTWSCYEGGALPCGRCDSCVLRTKGFREAGERKD